MIVLAYWIVAGVAALLFLTAGAMKLVRPRAALVDAGMGWASDFSTPQVKLIGALEVPERSD